EDFAEAGTLLNESARLLRAAGDTGGLAIVLAARAYVANRVGDPADWREPLRMALDLEAWPVAAWSLVVGAAVESDHVPRQAARWLAAGEAAYRELEISWDAAELRVRTDAETL